MSTANRQRRSTFRRTTPIADVDLLAAPSVLPSDLQRQFPGFAPYSENDDTATLTETILRNENTDDFLRNANTAIGAVQTAAPIADEQIVTPAKATEKRKLRIVLDELSRELGISGGVDYGKLYHLTDGQFNDASSDDIKGLVGQALNTGAQISRTRNRPLFALNRNSAVAAINTDRLFNQAVAARSNRYGSVDTTAINPLQLSRQIGIDPRLLGNYDIGIQPRLDTGAARINALLKQNRIQEARNELRRQIDSNVDIIDRTYAQQISRVNGTVRPTDSAVNDQLRQLGNNLDQARLNAIDRVDTWVGRERGLIDSVANGAKPSSSSSSSFASSSSDNSTVNNLAAQLSGDIQEARTLESELEADRSRYYDDLRKNVVGVIRQNPSLGFQVYNNRRADALERIALLEQRGSLPDRIKTEERRALADFDQQVLIAVQRAKMSEDARLDTMARKVAAAQKTDSAAAAAVGKKRRTQIATPNKKSSSSISQRFRDEFFGENLGRRRSTWWNDPNFPAYALLFSTALVGFIMSVYAVISSTTIMKNAAFSTKEKERARKTRIAFYVALAISALSLLGVPIAYGKYRQDQGKDSNKTSSSE